jgi:hypothetical protein
VSSVDTQKPMRSEKPTCSEKPMRSEKPTRSELLALSVAIITAASAAVSLESSTLGLLAAQRNLKALKAPTALVLAIWNDTEAPPSTTEPAPRSGRLIERSTLRPRTFPRGQVGRYIKAALLRRLIPCTSRTRMSVAGANEASLTRQLAPCLQGALR